MTNRVKDWLRDQVTVKRVAIAGMVVTALVGGVWIHGRLHTCRIEIQQAARE